MRSKQEIFNSRKIILTEQSHDGFKGIIHIRGWEGSVIASWGGGWDHVSVAPRKHSYVPSWDDMCALKELFFQDDEVFVFCYFAS